MPVKKKDTDRALALLEDYCKKLKKPEEQQLKKAIKKVMGIFKSSLFQALLERGERGREKQQCFDHLPATSTAYNPYSHEDFAASGLDHLMSNHHGLPSVSGLLLPLRLQSVPDCRKALSAEVAQHSC